MFEESADWDGIELPSSLSEALLAKPVATPTKQSKNKYKPNALPTLYVMSDPLQLEDDIEDTREGLVLTFIKSVWYTVVILLVMFAASVIFMGIEGNHHKMIGWMNIEEQEVFNKTLYKWITHGPKAAGLREHIGLSHDITEGKYEEIAQSQFDRNYSTIYRWANARCKIAEYDLKSWQTKTPGDSIMYAVSIVSTVGWGVFFPPTFTLRLITMLYAIVGLPLFAGFIGFGVRLVAWAENCLKEKRWIQKYMGGGGLINSLMLISGFSVVLLYSQFSVFLVNEEKSNHNMSHALEDLGEADHWTYFVSLYFTLQTVMTIGFGDEYVYSPAGAIVWLKPFICLVLTAFLIAVFSHIFNKIQAALDKKAVKNTVKSRETMKKLKRGVTRKVSNSKIARNSSTINCESENNKLAPVETPIKDPELVLEEPRTEGS